MTERESILARIREALRSVAPGSSPAPGRLGPPSPTVYEAVLPGVGPGMEARLECFRKESLELKTDFRLLEGEGQVELALRELGRAEGWKRIASHHGRLTDAVLAGLGCTVAWVDEGLDREALESCEAGITECDCLVAQTGTVVVTSRSAGGRGLSVLPPHHVVLARREQLVGGLPEAFELLQRNYGSDYPSMMSFITGPSRTGDIERILVLGAHGPKKLTVFCF